MAWAVASRSHISRTMAQSTHFIRTLHLYPPRPTYPPVKPPEPMVVKLTETENTICSNLDEFCKKRVQERPEEEPVVCRIAGGWVRDKARPKSSCCGMTCTERPDYSY